MASFLILVSLLMVRTVVSDGNEHNELLRVPSPSEHTDAVLIQEVGGGGAVADVHKELYLLPSGGDNFQGPNKVLDMNRLYDVGGLRLIWRTESLLEVHCPPSTRITDFTNHIRLENERGETYEMEIRLIPTTAAARGVIAYAPRRA